MKKGKVFRVINVALCVCILVTTFIGCTTNTNVKSTSASSKSVEWSKNLKDYTTTMKLSAYQGVNYGGPTNGPATLFAQKMKSEFKIDVDGFIWPSGEDVSQKIGLYAASGNIPDIIQMANTPANMKAARQMADAGMLLDVESYLKNCPNIMKYINSQILDSYRDTTNNKLYSVPAFTVTPETKSQLTIAANDVFMVRKDLLEKYGKGSPKTPDELYDLLNFFKSQPAVNGKKIIPYTPLWNGMEIQATIGDMFGIFRYRTSTVESEKRMLDMHETPDYLAYLKYAAKLYREGLIYSEPYTLQWQQVFNEMAPKGYIGLTNMWPSNITGLTQELQKNIPTASYEPMALPKAAGINETLGTYQTTIGGSFIVISKKVSDPIRIFKLLDWMCTNEGWATVCFGFPDEGENSTWYKDASGKLIDKGQAYQDSMSAKNAKWNADVLGAWGYGLTGVLKYTQDLMLDKYRQIDTNRATAKDMYKDDVYMNTTYDMYQAALPGPIGTAKQTDIDKIFKEGESKIIMTAKTDDQVVTMLSQMMTNAKSAGLMDVLKEDYGIYVKIKSKYPS
jgi:hypothetical protein